MGWATLLRAVRGPGRPGDPAPLLAAAVRLGTDVAPGVVGCSLTVGAPGRWTTPHASDPIALTLDGAQYEAGEGPCVEAAITGSAQQLDRIGADTRFPGFARAAAVHGVESSLSLPLPGAPERSALNLYGDHERAFDSARACAVADLLARLIGSLSQQAVVEEVESAVTTAFERGVLVRAGAAALARQTGVSDRDAYLVLAERSRQEQRPIVDLATQVRRDEGLVG